MSENSLDIQEVERKADIPLSNSGVIVKIESAKETDSNEAEELSFAEGGLQGWLTLLGAYINAFGVYQDFYVREYLTNYTPGDIGWIGGVQLFLNFSLGGITGRLFDKGYFRHLLVAGIVLHALAIFTLSLSHENSYYQVFLSQGLCLGFACGVIYVPSLSIASHYFQRRRSLAMGIVSAGSALGAVIHPIMLNKLFNGPVGFHNGVRISAGLNVALLIIALLIIRTRPPRKQADTGKNFPIIHFLRDVPYAVTVIAGLLTFCGLFFAVFYLQLFAVTRGVEENLAFYLLSIMNAASVIGRIVPNALVPYIGIFKLMGIFSVSLGVVMLCMAAVNDAAGAIVFAIFFGFCSGAAVSLAPPLLGALSKNINEIGARIGIFFLFASVLGLFSTPIAGALLTSDYHWLHAILFAGVRNVLDLYAESRLIWSEIQITMLAAGICYSLAGYLAYRQIRRAENGDS
ncbi:monocarboxylate permease [Crucibulum laeve]|uniref:Monocarboxylate permease n=1 Tax=Crucibulum laeve TaxID=68775 RepID=A0A5C3LHL8_9AGAR|nr:monocarboxylate permease [Crucibulum laeve]